MTDKQIIIDNLTEQLKRTEAQCEDMFVKHTDLEMKYKQKEQECEELKIYIESNEQQVKEVEMLVMDNDRLINELNQLKAELQRYKDMEAKGLEEFKDIGGCWGCGIQSSLDEVTKEFLQYKKSKQASYEALQKKCNELELENRELKRCYKNNSALLDFEETNTTKLVNKVIKLEKTLTEIKEYFIKECAVCKEQYAVDDYICSECQAYKLLQKISEVLDNEI